MNQHAIIAVAVSLALILLGIAVLAVQRLIDRRCDRLRFDPVHLVLRIIGWTLVAAGLLVSFASMLIVFFIPWTIVALIVLVEGLRKYRASQQYALLWLLTVSAERMMPLAPAVRAFAREQGGLFGRRALRLAELLDSGMALPDALACCGNMLPCYAMPMIRVGCESGALAPALRQAATVHNQFAPILTALVGKVCYLLLLPTFGLGILTFVMLKIVPAFEKIFKDFGTQLPWITRMLISVASGGDSLPLTIAWIVFVLLCNIMPFLVLYAVVRYFGLVQWDLPVLSQILRRLDSANVLDGLALVAGQQRPLGEGVASLAREYPKPNIRRRLQLANADIAVGGNWVECLFRRGLIRQADLAILQAAERVGNLPWALREMADSSRRRFFYQLQAVAQLAFPPAVIFFGLLVMFIVVALFMPLVTLISALA